MSTYTPIASQTLSTSAPSVTFSSIPQGYSDIVLVVQATSSGEIFMRFNSDTGANYSGTEIWTGGSGVNSQRASNENYMTLRDFSTTLGNNMSVANIMNYSNSTTNKTVLIRTNDNRYSRVYARVSLWRNTSAINQITLFNSSGTFASGSTFSLYGIAAGADGAKAAGGIVTSDNTYVYHTFLNSGIFIPYQNLTCDYLVVAGGGGGGDRHGGGGGAGGLRSTVTATGGGGSLETRLSLASNTNYTVTVGAGGAGGNFETNAGGLDGAGLRGSDSVFSTITSNGGAGGSTLGLTPTGTFGSGGGGAGNGPGPSSGTANQGYAGGNGSATTNNGGGGGGAGAIGGNASTTVGGAGGNGVAVSISGSSVTYAGGGGGGGKEGGGTGGAGGTGGGGRGGDNGTTTNQTAGTANTGGGGGGTRSENGSAESGSNGGSGIVIIRYAR